MNVTVLKQKFPQNGVDLCCRYENERGCTVYGGPIMDEKQAKQTIDRLTELVCTIAGAIMSRMRRKLKTMNTINCCTS